jgi:hypothetical protein
VRAIGRKALKDQWRKVRQGDAEGWAEGVVGLLLILVAGVVLIEYGGEILDIVTGLIGFSSTGLIALLVLLAGALAFVGLPLLNTDDDRQPVASEENPSALRGTARQNRALEILGAEKLRLLRAIRDMDFDYDMGKLTDDLYAEQRVTLIRRVIAIMKRTDAIEAQIRAQEDRVEAALAAFRAQE